MIIKYIKWELTGLVELVVLRLRSIMFRHTPPHLLRKEKSKIFLTPPIIRGLNYERMKC